MRFVLLFVVLVLVACAGPRHSSAPQNAAPQSNAAISYALTISADVQCIPFSTGQKGRPDTALCDFGQVLARCHAGVGAGSECSVFVDFRPRAGQQLEEQHENADAKKSDSGGADKPEPDK